MIEVILLERIERLGQMGDVVRVRPGFARNYLLPQKKALRANKANLAFFETQRAQLEAANLARKSDAEKAAEKIDGIAVIVVRQAGESGQLYGSVSSRDIADALKGSKVTVERNQIVLDKPIKLVGLHKVRVRLHPEVSAAVTVNVARTVDEAETQAKTGQAVTLESQRAAEEAAIEAALAEAAAVEKAAETPAEGEGEAAAS